MENEESCCTRVTIAVPSKQSIACNAVTIIYKLAYECSNIFSHALVVIVVSFLKQLAADTGYIVTVFLDGNICPDSKYDDAFRRRFESTMNRVNGFFCRQAAMKIVAKSEEERTDDEKNKTDLKEHD